MHVIRPRRAARVFESNVVRRFLVDGKIMQMAQPKQLLEAVIKSAPHEVWNAFVSIAFSSYDELDSVQRVAHHTLWYDSEINNGGHLQYFENHGTGRIEEVIQALCHIGAACQADVLTHAAKQRCSQPRNHIDTVEGYVEMALAGEYETWDRQFYDCRPDIPVLLKRYLERHESSFVTRVE